MDQHEQDLLAEVREAVTSAEIRICITPTFTHGEVDFLLTEHDDGTRELAVRPGMDRRDYTWGPPSLLLPEPVGS